MTKLWISVFLICVFTISLLGCKKSAQVRFHPFQDLDGLTYEEVVTAGFHRLSANDSFLVRFSDDQQLTFELEPDHCVPNIMKDGYTCSSYRLKERIFTKYFEQFDSLGIVNYLHEYGGKIHGNWKVDVTDINAIATKHQAKERYFQLEGDEKQFVGQVIIQPNGRTALNIKKHRGALGIVPNHKLSYLIEYNIRQKAKELLK
ncbi:MAG: hypothetical protein ACPGJS_21295 [Flammeovirgaceae bacterium]